MGACPPPPPPHDQYQLGTTICHFVEGWKHITNDPFVFKSVVAKGYRLRFTSRPLLLKTSWEVDLQDAYFHVLIHPDSRKYLHFAFENKVYKFRVLPFGLNTAAQVFTPVGQTVATYLHRQGISAIPYVDDWLIYHPHRQILLCHQSQLVNTLNIVLGLKLNEGKSELEPVQDIQFLGPQLRLDQGRASLPISKAREIIACACQLSSQKVLSYREVPLFMRSLKWASVLNPLGRLHMRPLQRHFHLLGLKNRFTSLCRSGPLVLATLLRQWLDLSFLTSGIPIRPFQAEFTISTDASIQCCGTTLGIPRSADCGFLDPLRTPAPHPCAGAQVGNFGPPTLGLSTTGPLCYDRYRLL